MKKAKPFRTLGPVNPKRDVYIIREVESELWTMLLSGNHCCIYSSRQAGKTSLMQTMKVAFRENGWLSIRVPLLNVFDEDDVLLCIQKLWDMISKELYNFNISIPLIDYSQEEEFYNRNPGEYLINLLVTVENFLPLKKRLLLMLDEFDAITTLNSTNSSWVVLLLNALKNWNDEKNVSKRIVLLVASLRRPAEMVMYSHNQTCSPNFFHNLRLPYFEDTENVHTQIAEQGFPDDDYDVIKKIISSTIKFTGGQPLLTCLLLQDIQIKKDRKGQLEKLKKEYLRQAESKVDGHILGLQKEFLESGGNIFSNSRTYKQILNGELFFNEDQSESLLFLRRIGLIKKGNSGHFIITNPFYEMRLTDRWMDEVVKKYEDQNLDLNIYHGKHTGKRIALIYTGGTIGMITSDGKATFDGAKPKIEEFVNRELTQIADIEQFELFDPLDGINVTPKKWLLLASFIHKHLDNFDGFIVTHGTDTMSFSASATAFILGSDIQKPVVFTGSQTTIDIPHGDAKDNLIRSCFVAANDKPIHEVQILFSDLVLRAVCTDKVDDRLYEGFRSEAWPELARVTEHQLIHRYAIGRPSVSFAKGFRPYMANNLMLITLAPGLKPDRYYKILNEEIENNALSDGIILTTPGVGNIPSIPPYNFRPFIQEAVNAGIPVLIASQVPINPYTQQQYEHAFVSEQYGAILTGNLTFPAAMTKFAWIIGCVNNEMKDFSNIERQLEIKLRMKENYLGELGEYDHKKP